MSLSAKIRRAPLRATTGAYILSSGFDKIQAGDEQAKGLHGFAASAYPVFEKVQPKVFTRALGVAEMSLGAALLLPVVPPVAVALLVTGMLEACLNSRHRFGQRIETPHLAILYQPPTESQYIQI